MAASSKALRDDYGGRCPLKKGSRTGYFCCDYDFNRCEIELFTKLGSDKEAIVALRESLLNTKHDIAQDGLHVDLNV